MDPDRAYAAKHLTAFLQHVGPIEAVWALITALEALQDLTPGEDHVAAATQALGESLAEFEELAAAAESDEGGEALLAEGDALPPTEPESTGAPKAPTRKSSQRS